MQQRTRRRESMRWGRHLHERRGAPDTVPRYNSPEARATLFATVNRDLKQGALLGWEIIKLHALTADEFPYVIRCLRELGRADEIQEVERYIREHGAGREA